MLKLDGKSEVTGNFKCESGKDLRVKPGASEGSKKQKLVIKSNQLKAAEKLEKTYLQVLESLEAWKSRTGDQPAKGLAWWGDCL